jgi:hypothetical protein
VRVLDELLALEAGRHLLHRRPQGFDLGLAFGEMLLEIVDVGGDSHDHSSAITPAIARRPLRVAPRSAIFNSPSSWSAIAVRD